MELPGLQGFLPGRPRVGGKGERRGGRARGWRVGSGSNSTLLDKPGAQLLWVEVLGYLAPGMSPRLAYDQLSTYHDLDSAQAIILPRGNTWGQIWGAAQGGRQDLSLPEWGLVEGLGQGGAYWNSGGVTLRGWPALGGQALGHCLGLSLHSKSGPSSEFCPPQAPSLPSRNVSSRQEQAWESHGSGKPASGPPTAVRSLPGQHLCPFWLSVSLSEPTTAGHRACPQLR